MNKYDVIIDTDIGDDIDDAFALCLAMQSPELNVIGVTTVHGDTKKRAQIAKRLLSLGGFGNVPVHAGESKALKTDMLYGRDVDYDKVPSSYLQKYSETKYDGDNAVEFIIKTLEEREKTVIITLGALTNIAKVLLLRPDLKSKIQFLSIMGGAFFMNFGEFNFCCDPEAANIVLESGLQMYATNIDITIQCVVSDDLSKKLFSVQHPCIQMLKEMREKWTHAVMLHDPLAVMNVYNRQFVEFAPQRAVVETQGEFSKGYCINMTDWNWQAKPETYNINVGKSVKAKEFSEECINRLLKFGK